MENKVCTGEAGYRFLAMKADMDTISKKISIARQVKQRMKEAEIDNEVLSNKTGFSKFIIKKILRADYNLNLKQISILENALGIKIHL